MGAGLVVYTANAADVQYLDMAQALNLALSQGQSMQVAGSKVSAMAEAYAAAEKSVYPTLKVDGYLQRGSGEATTFLATQGRSTPDNPLGSVTGNYAAGHLTFNVPIYDKGAMFYQQGPEQMLARANLEAAQASSRAQAVDVTNKVAKAFFQALQSQDEAATQEALLRKRQQELQHVKERVASRIVTRGEELEMEVAVANSRQAVNSAQRAAAVQLVQLRLLLRLPAQTPIALAGPSLDLPPELPPVEDVATSAAAERPDVKNQEAQVRVAEAQYAETKAKSLPTLDFKTDYIASTDLDRTSPSFLISGLVLSYTIADFGQNDSSAKSKALLVQEQKNGVEVVRDTASYEVYAAYAAVADARDKLEVANRKVEQAAYNESSTRQLYEAGKMGLDKLLALEDTLLAAKVALLSARYAVWTAYADLFKVAGMNYTGDHRFSLH
jgi:outer membrane protein TolC